MLSFLGWFTSNPYQNKTMFIYIFLASFRSQERANNHNDKATRESTNNWFYEQNNNFVHTSLFLDVHCTVGSLVEYVNIQGQIFLCLF